MIGITDSVLHNLEEDLLSKTNIYLDIYYVCIENKVIDT